MVPIVVRRPADDGLAALRSPAHSEDPPFDPRTAEAVDLFGMMPAAVDGHAGDRDLLPALVRELLPEEMISLPAIESTLLAAMSEGAEEGSILAVLATSDADRPELVLYTTKAVEREEVNLLIGAAGLSPLHYIRRVIRVESIPVLGTGRTDYRTLEEGAIVAGG